MYEVLPSYGHVRDLAGRSKSVRPDDDFSMVWEVPAAALTHLNLLQLKRTKCGYFFSTFVLVRPSVHACDPRLL